ncbi:MAG: CRISPR-associated protein Cas2 [Spirochaetales bacterium]|nr:CRISPR-associated protein Cas2 [Spirochaetales bacterium]
MFVAVIIEMSNEDHEIAVDKILKLYGFKPNGKYIYESNTIGETTLTRLKREIDKVSDSYDIVNFYQYPIEGTLVVTTLAKKKWHRRIMQQEE